MPKFPVDAPNGRVVRAMEILGFRIVREGNHIAMERVNPDGTRTPLTDYGTHQKGPAPCSDSWTHPVLTSSLSKQQEWLDHFL